MYFGINEVAKEIYFKVSKVNWEINWKLIQLFKIGILEEK